MAGTKKRRMFLCSAQGIPRRNIARWLEGAFPYISRVDEVPSAFLFGRQISESKLPWVLLMALLVALLALQAG
jgi:hypothetical protein